MKGKRKESDLIEQQLSLLETLYEMHKTAETNRKKTLLQSQYDFVNN